MPLLEANGSLALQINTVIEAGPNETTTMRGYAGLDGWRAAGLRSGHHGNATSHPKDSQMMGLETSAKSLARAL